MQIIKHSKIWLTISAALVLVSIILLATLGLNLSADFVPGTMLKLKFEQEISTTDLADYLNTEVTNTLSTYTPDTEESDYTPLGVAEVRTTSDGSLSVRTLRQSEATQALVLSSLTDHFGTYELREVRNVSPIYAEAFLQSAYLAITIASIAIILYIAYAFRRVPRHVSKWKFGIIAVATLIHDVIITVGAFVLLGYFVGVQIDGLFITALLTVLGYSVNDTIVVFDRIRENLKNMGRNDTFADIANTAVNQSVSRSINTSLSTLITLTALFLLGADSIRWFVFALIIGTIVGTYSSIFLASPLLTLWQGKTK